MVDANSIARELGLGRHTNTILQASFFSLNPSIMPYDEALKWMKKFAEKTYFRKGEEVVKQNFEAIDAGANGVKKVNIPSEWADLKPLREMTLTGDKYFDKFVMPIDNLEGYDLPTSTFVDEEFALVDGSMKGDVTFRQKRRIADMVPHWNKDNCINVYM